MNQAATSKPNRILRLPEVMHTVGLSRSTIYRMMDKGLFPRQVRVGIAAVGWDASEIAYFLTERKLASIH